ncbi:MAG: hypothetical protein RLZZ568_780 [Cyanobacteriota bacterium]
MYNLEVNLLKERTPDLDRSVQTTAVTLEMDGLHKQMPIYIGGAVMLLLPTLAGLATLVVDWQTGKIQADLQQLEREMTQFQGEDQRIQALNAQTASIHQEADGLINVLNQVKPWSALFQEMSNQLPLDVQLESIRQAGEQLTLSGVAENYAALNDFLLALQSSQFLQAEQTKLMAATTESSPTTDTEETAGEGNEAETTNTELGTSRQISAGVRYTIQTALTATPDQDLMPVLMRNGAIGLVARFKFLEQKGVLTRPRDAPSVPPPPMTTPADEAADPQSE